jgi:type VI secretion system protein ImpL
MGSARERLNSVWASTLRPECEQALGSRYPFYKDGRFDVTIDDFGRFFAPNGKLDQFFKQQLKPLVDTSQKTWQWLTPKQGTGALSSEALRQMQRAATIREAFFMDGGQLPRINFELKPVYLDKQVKRVTLDLEGQGFKYDHGPQRFQDAQWPGPLGSSQVRIIFKATDNTEAVISREGPWAWFRMLDQAQKRVISPDRFVATFQTDGRRADYEIRASSVVNPFIMRDLKRFRCPREF